MSSYIYRGVKYSQSNTLVDFKRQNTFMYRGVPYTKQEPMAVTLDKSKICYRGFRLAEVTASEASPVGAFSGFFSHYKLAH